MAKAKPTKKKAAAKKSTAAKKPAARAAKARTAAKYEQSGAPWWKRTALPSID